MGINIIVPKFWGLEVGMKKTVFPTFGIENGNEKQYSQLKMGKN